MTNSRRQPIFLLLLIIGFLALFYFASHQLYAQEPEQHELQAVWERVRQSGAYKFSADITQTLTPQPTAVNAGRKAKETRLYLEGRTDLPAESVTMTLWSQGGSALMPESGAQIRVEKGQAYARRGNSPWEEVGDFYSSFAPGGDFLGYLAAAENVVRHAPERRHTALGDITFTRYTYDISGYRFAVAMRRDLTEQLAAAGELPPSVTVDLTKAYADMNGTGELWVGTDGLPIRQIFDLQFPERRDNYLPTARGEVSFTNFASLPEAAALRFRSNTLLHTIATSISPVLPKVNATDAPDILLPVLTLALTGCLVVLVVRRRMARQVYALVAIGVSASILLTPLLTAYGVQAAGERRSQREAQQEAQQAEADAREDWQLALATPSVEPHADPFAMVNAQVKTSNPLANNNGVSSSSSDDGRYFDDLCETDPGGDSDGDTLTNLQECLLGSLPGVADSDNDGLNDNVEVSGVVLTDTNGVTTTWYLDPLNMDTNNDGLGDGQEWHLDVDTDGDGEPDIWDLDNDGDGVIDSLDLSAYSNSLDVPAYNGDNPLSLIVDQLTPGRLTKVEFQLRPTNPDHLWYSQSVLDWPVNDRRGNMQDADGLTFFDVDSTLTASPNDNGDVRLIPMLEIEITGSPTNLADENILEQFGISVHQTGDNSWSAYVPLQLTTDSNGDQNVAFYGRMFYRADTSWGNAHLVRMVWAVQALVDQCESYSDNVCDSYSAYNDLQIIQTYYDDWHLTGLHVTEEHSADIDLIYEDPDAPELIAAGGDAPFLMDTLYGLLYGLDHTFLAGSDCDTVDSNGDCVGNGERDVTVSEIYRRFNYTTNNGVTITETWGLPDVLGVIQPPTYESIDLAMVDTTVTQTLSLLESVYTDDWSPEEPITPTIMFAFEQVYRSVNLDGLHIGNNNLDLNGSSLQVSLPSSGPTAISVDTIASLKWTPYAYNAATGWNPADIDAYMDAVTPYLGDVFADSLGDPEEAETYQTMSQLLYNAAYSGDSNVVQVGPDPYTAEWELPNAPVRVTLTATLGKKIVSALKGYFKYSQKLEDIAKGMEEERTKAMIYPRGVTRAEALEKDFRQNAGLLLKDAKGIAILVVSVIFVIAVIGVLVAKYLLHKTNSAWNIAFAVAVGVPLLVFTIIIPVLSVVRAAQAAVAAGKGLSFAEALLSNLFKADQLVTGAVKWLGIVGLLISVVVAGIVFVLLWAHGRIHPGTVEFNLALAQSFAVILVAVLFFILSFNPIGVLVTSVIVLVDTVLSLLGSKFSITGWLTKEIVPAFYRYNPQVDLPVGFDSGSLGMELVDQDAGIVAGNQMAFSLPMTTTITRTISFLEYPFEYPEANILRQSSLAYDLSANQESLTTKKGARASEWSVTWESIKGGQAYHEVGKISETKTATVTLTAGIDQPVPLFLNSAYALPAQQCWILFCNSRTVSGGDSNYIGANIPFDVLPDTLDGFVAATSWSDGQVVNVDADGDGLLSRSAGGVDPNDGTWDADGDGLSDPYELTIRGMPAEEGGVYLDPIAFDTDGDTIHDGDELRLGTDPNSRDTDGDGISDLDESGPHGGWLLPYAPDKFARTWSDPSQSDADGDGMNDLFERTQTTCTTCTPWADPANPLVFSPAVWNESPVPLYVSDTSSLGFVAPADTIVYTTTTTNNLSSNQSLAGDLTLDIPGAFSGSPLAAGVNLVSGQDESLVTSLTAGSTGTTAGTLTSTMNLTDFADTVWSWDSAATSSATTLNGAASDLAATSVSGWNQPFLMVAREIAGNGTQSIVAYTASGDGVREESKSLNVAAAGVTLTAPALACSETGECLIVWGRNEGSNGSVHAALLYGGLNDTAAVTVAPASPGVVFAPVAASDGGNFMFAYGLQSGNSVRFWVRPVHSDGTLPGSAKSLAGPGDDLTSVALSWGGGDYLAVWAQAGQLRRANVAADTAAVSGVSTIGPGSGWPSAAGERAPRLAFDAISQQALLLYRAEVASSDQLHARRLTAGGASPDTVIGGDAGLNNQGVRTALCVDPTNGGWVAAWTVPGQGETYYEAIGPDGSLRGLRQSISTASDLAPALACGLSRPLLDLEFEESSGATTFVDSSGYGRNATCSGNACPTAGVVGRLGNGVTFDGTNDELTVSGGVDLANRSFTVSVWAKRETTLRNDFIFSLGQQATNQGLHMGFRSNDRFTCGFLGDDLDTSQLYFDVDWHHWVCTYNVETGQRTLFRDSVQVAQDIAAANYSGPASELLVGTFFNQYYFLGVLDAFQIYDRLLSPTEIGDIFVGTAAVYGLDEIPGSTSVANETGSSYTMGCSGSNCPTFGLPGISNSAAHFDGVNDYLAASRPEYSGGSLQANYYLDEAAGATSFANALSSAYTFTCSGSSCPTAGGTGVINSALEFDGSNDRVQTSSFLNSSDGTIAVWLKPGNLSSGDPSNSEFIFKNGQGAGLWIDYFGNINCAPPSAIQLQGPIIDNQWHQWVCVWRSGGARELYMDGLLFESKTNQSASGPFFSGGSATMGHSGGTSTFDIYYHGGIDEAKFWSSALDAGSVLALYNTESSQKVNFPLAGSSFTISAWARRDAPGTDDYILSQGLAVDHQGLHFGYRANDHFTCAFWNDPLDTALAYMDTDWHHWACTYDEATRQRTLYRDGVQVAQNTATADYTGVSPTYIGRDEYQPSPGYFGGNIDEVAVWTSVLTANQVEALYNKVKVLDQAVMAALLPGADGTTSLDLSKIVLRETTNDLGEITQSVGHTLTIDADNPTTEILAPADGDYVAPTGVLVISGEASDATAPISLVEVNVGNGWQPADGTASWSYEWDVSAIGDGASSISARSTDVVGNVGPFVVAEVNIDHTPPAVSVDAGGGLLRPTRGAQGRWQVPLAGTVSDSGVGSIAAVDVLLQGAEQLAGFDWQPAHLSGGTWNLDYLMSQFGVSNQSQVDPSGVYTVTVRATDTLSNTTPAENYITALLTLDAGEPIISLINPISTTQTISTALTIAGQVADASTVSGVEVNVTPAEQISALGDVVLHLPFDENQNTEFFPDQSGANNPAGCTGDLCPQVGQGGQRDKSISFDGVDDFLLVEDVELNERSFTLAAWAKRDAPGTADVILSQGLAADHQGLHFGYRANGHFTCAFWNDPLDTALAYTDTDWHHWACTYDATTRQRTLYRDGAQVAQNIAIADYTGVSPTYIGRDEEEPSPAYFDGNIDEVTVQNRVLADYEVANLYAYGLGTWESAVVAGNDWSYTIPDGVDGLEGIFQINVRGVDELGNTTGLDGQRQWRGEIDTRPPSLDFTAVTSSAGGFTTTTYLCDTADFNLDGSQACKHVGAPPPNFRPPDMSSTTYDMVNAWYAATITDTSRLYAIEASHTYSEAVNNAAEVQSCDLYGRCTTAVVSATVSSLIATPDVEVSAGEANKPAGAATLGAEITSPSSGTVLTMTTPISVSGFAHSLDGLQTLTVTVDSAPIYVQTWPDPSVTSTPWSFTWAPPGEGVYLFEATVADWNGNNAAGDLPATIYIDLGNPLVNITPLVLTTTHQLGDEVVRLAGTAVDAAQVALVEVRVDGGEWDRAGYDAGQWQWPWHLGETPDGASFAIDARVTDLADRMAFDTETVVVDIAAPAPVDVNLSYTDGNGSSSPIVAGDTLTDAVSLKVGWTASSDGSGIAVYQVGWTQSAVPDPALLTDYFGPGTHTQAVGEAETWYAHVRLIDGVGNLSSQTVGPIYVDSHLSPDIIHDLAYQGWANGPCSIQGIDHRLARTHPDTMGDKVQRMYISWDATALRLTWQGANWSHEGDLFIYLDTRLGGADQLYNPYPASTGTTIYLPGNTPDPIRAASERQAAAQAGVSVENQIAMQADYMVWVESADQASLWSWNGAAWQRQGDMDEASFNLLPGADNSLTDILLSFGALGIDDPAGSALGLLAVATEEDSLALWSSMPTRNPLNSDRLVNPIAALSDAHTFALARSYFWTSLGSDLCPNGRLSGGGPLGGAFADSDLQFSLTVDPIGTTYAFMKDDLAWLWTLLFGFETGPGLPSLLFEHMDNNHPALGPDQEVTYTIHYTNLGLETATGVELDLKSWFSLDLPDQVIELGDIPAGASGSLDVVATIDPAIALPEFAGWAALDILVFDDQSPRNPGGPWSSAPLEFIWSDHTVDHTGPTEVGITRPEALVPVGEVIVSGFAHDQSSVPLVNLQVRPLGGNSQTIPCPQEAPQNGNWRCAWNTSTTSDGDIYELRAQAVDEFGQSSEWTEWHVLVVDDTPPELTVKQPTVPGQLFGANIQAISGGLTDDRRIGSVLICVGEEPCRSIPAQSDPRVGAQLMATDGVWSAKLPAPDTRTPDGLIQTLTVVGLDSVGNRTEPRIITYRLDTTPPALTVSEVISPVIGYGSPLVADGDVSDGSAFDVYVLVRPPAGLQFRIKANVTGDQWVFRPGWTVPGVYIIWIQAVDAAGNITTDGPYQTMVLADGLPPPPPTVVVYMPVIKR